MDDWKKFNEVPLPEKEDFYIHLNMEDTTDADYARTNFETKNLGKHWDFHVQSDTLLLAECLRTLGISFLN